jgi:hypothetical protein
MIERQAAFFSTFRIDQDHEVQTYRLTRYENNAKIYAAVPHERKKSVERVEYIDSENHLLIKITIEELFRFLDEGKLPLWEL